MMAKTTVILGSRIELFARQKRSGWDVLGNQADSAEVDDELLKAA